VQRAGLFQVHAALPAACMRPGDLYAGESGAVAPRQ
jgi:hypothetical protein